MTSEDLTPERLGAGWRYVHKSAQEWLSLADSEDGWHVATGSHLAKDDRRSAPLQTSHAAQGILHSSIDHLHAATWSQWEQRTLHTFAGATLARASLETAATVIWLLESDDTKERVRRTLRWNCQDLRDRQSAEAELGKPADNTELERRIGPVADRNGLQMREVNQPLRSTQILKVADAVLAARGEPLQPLLFWRLCSGFAHGRRWASLAFLDQQVQEKTEQVLNVRLSMSDDRALMLCFAAHAALETAIDIYRRRSGPPRPPSAAKRGAGNDPVTGR